MSLYLLSSGIFTVTFFCSRLYVKVVIVSKVPLPNYRFDLDDKRPQREVIFLETIYFPNSLKLLLSMIITCLQAFTESLQN